jgi:hypothetical protein
MNNENFRPGFVQALIGAPNRALKLRVRLSRVRVRIGFEPTRRGVIASMTPRRVCKQTSSR